MDKEPGQNLYSDFTNFMKRYDSSRPYDVYEVKDYLEPVDPVLKINKVNSGNNYFDSNLEELEEEDFKSENLDQEDSNEKEKEEEKPKKKKSNHLFTQKIRKETSLSFYSLKN